FADPDDRARRRAAPGGPMPFTTTSLAPFILLLAMAVPASAGVDTTLTAHPTYSPGGRLVLELRGDLWLAPDPANPASLIRLTEGAAHHVEPPWTADGRAVVYASDRNGAFHLWRLEVGSDGARGAAVQVTRGSMGDREPTVAPDGSIVFVRGRGTAAQIWVRDPDGTERQLTNEPGGARMPAISPDGKRVAYS